jgi:hypothetical protein
LLAWLSTVRTKDSKTFGNIRCPPNCRRHGAQIDLPFRIIGIGVGFDFDMPFDFDVARFFQANDARFAATILDYTLQNIVSIAYSGEIFPMTPAQAFAGMAA